MNGEISGSIPYLTSSYQTLQIPQIDVDIVYKTGIYSTDNEIEPLLTLNPDPAISSRVFEDSTFVGIDPDHLLLEVLEENTEYNKTNVEIEVYEIEEDDRVSAKSGLAGSNTMIENMKPLYFDKPKIMVENNILLDSPITIDTKVVVNDTSMANYYFNVFVDNEIDLADLCAAKTTFEEKSLFVGLDIDCIDTTDTTPTKYNVYLDGATTARCEIDSTNASDSSDTECED